MVHILSKLDPTNEQWKKMMLDKAVSESRTAFQAESKEEREERLKDIENSFDENLNNPDYARKLYLIENCIYGVDIQPIAIQISKLRFFISLVVDQKTTTDPVNNFGIRPLPNLEAKFVAANSLIPLAKAENNLGRTPEIIALENELKEANHKIFGAKTVRTKRKWRQRLIELRTEMAEKLADNGFLTTDAANQLASWDMFNQNTSASFFDAEWMFGVKDGFDVVIGNPPYVLLQNTNITPKVKDLLLSSYYVAQYKVDLYHLFYEKGLEIIKKGGILSYITPIAFLKNTHNNKLRQKLVSESSIQAIIRFFIPVFDASVDNTIFICRKGRTANNTVRYIDIKNDINEIIDNKFSGFYNQELANSPDYSLALDVDVDNHILSKIRQNSHLNDFAKSYFGIQTFDRSVFVSNAKLDDNYMPVIDGTNIKRYALAPHTEYVNFTPEAIKSGGNPNVYSCDRIVIRQIGIYPEGCICPSGLYTLNTIYNLYLWNNKLSLEYLLGLINSKLLHYYWILTYSDSKKTFPKIKKAPLDSMPIVDSQDKRTKNKIVSLVTDILTIKRTNPNANTTSDEQEIDRLVYKLYGLTYDEVKIVDPNTPITKEEYNKE